MTAPARKVIAFGLDRKDIEILKAVVGHELETGIKTGMFEERVRMYRLKRRFHRALLELERR